MGSKPRVMHVSRPRVSTDARQAGAGAWAWGVAQREAGTAKTCIVRGRQGKINTREDAKMDQRMVEMMMMMFITHNGPRNYRFEREEGWDRDGGKAAKRARGERECSFLHTLPCPRLLPSPFFFLFPCFCFLP